MELDDKDEFYDPVECTVASTAEGWTEIEAKAEADLLTARSRITKWFPLFADNKWHAVREDWIERFKAKVPT